MSDAVAATIIEREPSVSLVPTSNVHPDLITSAPAPLVKAQQDAYHELCKALLDNTDIMSIQGKDFKKKSAWRKLAVAFNVSDTVISKEYEREGRAIIRAEFVVRATAPNGRSTEGYGACDIAEKCCPKATGGNCRKSGKHYHCAEGCTGGQHFSNPSHDIPATAHTRAKNRALSDLFGMGEVSAEEITERHDDDEPEGTQKQSRPSSKASKKSSPPPSESYEPTDSDRKQILVAQCKKLGDTGPEQIRSRLSSILGREIKSAGDLGHNELVSAIDMLAELLATPMNSEESDPKTDAPSVEIDPIVTDAYGWPVPKTVSESLADGVDGLSVNDLDAALAYHFQSVEGDESERRDRLFGWKIEEWIHAEKAKVGA